MGVTISPKGPFESGKTVPLVATAGEPVKSWQWAQSDQGSAFTDISAATSSTFDLKVDDYLGKTLRATAQFTSGGSDSGDLKIEKAPDTEGAGGDGNDPPAEPPSVWHVKFAWISAVVTIALFVAFILVTSLEEARLGLDEAAYKKLDGRALVGAAVIGPIALVGVAVTLIGVWMVAVEWRGRFAPKAAGEVQAKGLPDIGTVVTALGKLKGATLVLLSGVTILLAVSWMTGSTAGAEPSSTPTGTETTTSAPTGTATTP